MDESELSSTSTERLLADLAVQTPIFSKCLEAHLRSGMAMPKVALMPDMMVWRYMDGTILRSNLGLQPLMEMKGYYLPSLPKTTPIHLVCWPPLFLENLLQKQDTGPRTDLSTLRSTGQDWVKSQPQLAQPEKQSG